MPFISVGGVGIGVGVIGVGSRQNKMMNKFMALKCFKLASSTIDSETQDSSPVNETEDVSFANSWIMTIILVLVALLLSIFNIILLVQIKDSI